MPVYTGIMTSRLLPLWLAIVTGFLLGAGVLEKLRFGAFLLQSRFLPQGRNREFRIRANNTSFIVCVRDNFSDLFVLHEAFLGKEYEADLPTEDPEIIFDVGANVGYVALYLITRYPRARIFCFEPDLETFTQLEANTKQFPNVRCFRYAIGSRDESRPLYRSPHFHMRNSLLPFASSESASSIETLSFASALARAGVSRVDLMKIDIEGSELELFEGNFPFASVQHIVGELHPTLWPAEAYERLVSTLRTHYATSLRNLGRKVFFTARAATAPFPQETPPSL